MILELVQKCYMNVTKLPDDFNGGIKVSICWGMLLQECIQFPGDLLIVDEVDTLVSNSFGQADELTKIFRVISPLFEHRFFANVIPAQRQDSRGLIVPPHPCI
jgi:hypothetical protein